MIALNCIFPHANDECASVMSRLVYYARVTINGAHLRYKLEMFTVFFAYNNV